MVHSMVPLGGVARGGFREALAAGTPLDSSIVFTFIIYLFDLQHVNISLNYSFLCKFSRPQDSQIQLLSKQKIHS